MRETDYAMAEKDGPAKPLEWQVPLYPWTVEDDVIVAVAMGIGGVYSIERINNVSYYLWMASDEFQWTECASIDEAKMKAEFDWQHQVTTIIKD